MQNLSKRPKVYFSSWSIAVPVSLKVRISCPQYFLLLPDAPRVGSVKVVLKRPTKMTVALNWMDINVWNYIPGIPGTL